MDAEGLIRPGALVSRRSLSGIPRRGRERDLTGFLAIRPMPLPCSKTPAEPAGPRLLRPCRHRPRSTHTEGLNGYIISRLTQGFIIRCLRFTSGVTASHARLASGWRAAPLPGGGRTLWIASKGFRLRFHSPFQDFSCRKGRLCQAPVRRASGRAGLSVALYPPRRHCQQPADLLRQLRRHLPVEGLSRRKSRPPEGHDTRHRRVHPQILNPRPAERLPPHPPLRPVRQRHARRQHRPGA